MAPTTTDRLRQLLRERGLQVTSARLSVLQVLADAHEHRTVEEIRTEVLTGFPTIDMATVYRTLETLEDHGLAVRMSLGDKVTRWAHVGEIHHHLVCRRCKAVVELDDAPFRRLAAELGEQRGVKVEMQHLVLHGLCPACAEGTQP